jgi:hypothetical protein
MTLTVRLDPELERRLAVVCKRRRTTKSAIVTELVQEYVAREPSASSYEIAARLGVIGADASGPANRASKAKQYIRRALRAKRYR